MMVGVAMESNRTDVCKEPNDRTSSSYLIPITYVAIYSSPDATSNPLKSQQTSLLSRSTTDNLITGRHIPLHIPRNASPTLRIDLAQQNLHLSHSEVLPNATPTTLRKGKEHPLPLRPALFLQPALGTKHLRRGKRVGVLMQCPGLAGHNRVFGDEVALQSFAAGGDVARETHRDRWEQAESFSDDGVKVG